MLVLLTGLTLIFAMLIVRAAPVAEPPPTWEPHQVPDALGPRERAAIGVSATFRIGDRTIYRAMSAIDVTLAAGESIDADLPAGAFIAEYDATFETRTPQTVRIGASHFGGLLMVRLGRQLLFSEFAEPPSHASDDARVTMSNYLDLQAGVHTVHYRFEREGDGPAHLRALWQPIDLDAPAALPTDRG